VVEANIVLENADPYRLILCVDKINRSPRVSVATHRFRAPIKIITTQQAPDNPFSFSIKADGWYTSAEILLGI